MLTYQANLIYIPRSGDMTPASHNTGVTIPRDQIRHLRNCFHFKTMRYPIKLFKHADNSDWILSTDDIIPQINVALHSNATASACSEIRAGYSLRNIFPRPRESRWSVYRGKKRRTSFHKQSVRLKGACEKTFSLCLRVARFLIFPASLSKFIVSFAKQLTTVTGTTFVIDYWIRLWHPNSYSTETAHLCERSLSHISAL